MATLRSPSFDKDVSWNPRPTPPERGTSTEPIWSRLDSITRAYWSQKPCRTRHRNDYIMGHLRTTPRTYDCTSPAVFKCVAHHFKSGVQRHIVRLHRREYNNRTTERFYMYATAARAHSLYSLCGRFLLCAYPRPSTRVWLYHGIQVCYTTRAVACYLDSPANPQTSLKTNKTNVQTRKDDNRFVHFAPGVCCRRTDDDYVVLKKTYVLKKTFDETIIRLLITRGFDRFVRLPFKRSAIYANE